MKDKLPKVFKKKWIAALRSGKYKQGQLHLYIKEENSFCCLGVAEVVCGTPVHLLHHCQIPKDLKTPNTPEILHADNYHATVVDKLTTFNDNGKSFRWISNWIEKNL